MAKEGSSEKGSSWGKKNLRTWFLREEEWWLTFLLREGDVLGESKRGDTEEEKNTPDRGGVVGKCFSI